MVFVSVGYASSQACEIFVRELGLSHWVMVDKGSSAFTTKLLLKQQNFIVVKWVRFFSSVQQRESAIPTLEAGQCQTSFEYFWKCSCNSS